MEIRNVTIGADPEMFIVDTSKDNKVISAVGLIPGEKGTPWAKKEWASGFGMEIDNVLAEFNIPPVSDKKTFIEYMNFMKNEIRKFVKEVNKDYDILCTASKMVDEDQLQSPEAKLFGCSVDYNVYTESENPKPNGESTNLRSAGCHIHVGYFMPTVGVSLTLIKYLDLFLGVPSVLLDTDRKRRSLYGKAGCFRLCPYGFEYRTLSSKMYSTDAYMEVIWDGVELAIWAYNNGLPLASPNEVRKAIDNSDIKTAKAIMKWSSSIDTKIDHYNQFIYSLLK